MEHAHHLFADDGDIPNNPHLPMIVYRGAIDPTAGDPAAAFERLFSGNGWGGGWRNGIFAFPHYHADAHEVLGIARGRARVRLGGGAGDVFEVEAGDAVLLPAGTGHQRVEASGDLLVIGAYPPGQNSEVFREGAEDKEGIRARIARVALPEADPIAGPDGPTSRLWR